MNILSLFNTEIHLGRTILLAWLVASLLHFQWGTPIAIRDVPPVEFILQAGLVFGYLVALITASRLIALLIWLLIWLTALRRVLPIDSDIKLDPLWRVFIRFGRFLANTSDVVAMFAAFLLFSEVRLGQLAPIGLGVALALFVLGFFDETASSRDSPGGKDAG